MHPATGAGVLAAIGAAAEAAAAAAAAAAEGARPTADGAASADAPPGSGSSFGAAAELLMAERDQLREFLLQVCCPLTKNNR